MKIISLCSDLNFKHVPNLGSAIYVISVLTLSINETLPILCSICGHRPQSALAPVAILFVGVAVPLGHSPCEDEECEVQESHAYYFLHDLPSLVGDGCRLFDTFRARDADLII